MKIFFMVPMASSPQWDDCFGYNARWGYVKDATGLYYCQNRYYDPANGRWLTRDPIGYEGGINLYGYSGGGPVGAIDPWGLMDSVSAFCRRFPAFCVELAEELGGGAGAGATGAGVAGVVSRELSDGDNDEVIFVQEAGHVIARCWSRFGNQFYSHIGKAAHRVLNRRFAENGYVAERPLPGGGIPDLSNTLTKMGVELTSCHILSHGTPRVGT